MRWWWLLALAGCERVLNFQQVTTASDSPRALVFDNSSSSEDLIGFVVLIELDANNFELDAITDPAHDLRFHDEVTDTDLPFEIESYDPLGKLDLWVRVPVIHAHSTADRVLMFFGPKAAGSDDVAGTWTDYDFVFHANTMLDSTAHSTPQVSSPSMPTIAPSAIGQGLAFTGANQVVAMSGGHDLLSNWPTFTVEMWIEPQYSPDPYNLGKQPSGQPNEPGIITKPGGALQLGRLRNSNVGSASPLRMQTDFFWQNQTPLQGAIFFIPDNEWSYVTFSYDGQYLWWYRNATILDVHANTAIATTRTDVTGVLTIGSNGAPFLGSIDEVRVTRGYHDESWMVAQYLSMSRHFVSIEAP